jgi:glucosamine 6-phosphate synthetase-like amidotransferase/phosphosugar isomerase protein
MCGVFGFVSLDDQGPDIELLKRIAVVTQSRGEHAFGLAWVDAAGRLQSWKRPGPATANLADLDRVAGAQAVIGHCRWATHGSPEENANNHPHRSGRGWVVHNGVVSNYQSLARRYELTLETACDSEALAKLISKQRGLLLRRAARTAEAALGNMALLGLWTNPLRFLMLRDKRPLHFGDAEEGFYLASLPDGLPGDVRSLPDSYAGVLTRGEDGLLLTSGRIDDLAA